MKFITFSFIALVFTSCLHMAFYRVQLNNGSNSFKKYFENNKVVSTIEVSPYHGGTFWIYLDFAFDRKLILDLSESRIKYNGMEIQPHSLYFKEGQDRLSIDGDDNLSINFSLPPGFHDGDSLLIDMRSFVKDQTGKQYSIDPFYLKIYSVSKKEFKTQTK